MFSTRNNKIIRVLLSLVKNNLFHRFEMYSVKEQIKYTYIFFSRHLNYLISLALGVVKNIKLLRVINCIKNRRIMDFE